MRGVFSQYICQGGVFSRYTVKCCHHHQGLWEEGFSRYIYQVSPVSSGPMKVGVGLFSRYISQMSPASSGPMRGGFSRYICQLSPLSSGPMRGVFSRYICQVSPLSSGPIRGGTVGTSVKCDHYHQVLWEGVQ